MKQELSKKLAKEALGKAAADLVQENMIVGLGTGSTAACFIDSLITRCQQGLSVQAVATSLASQKQAEAGGIKVLDIDEVDRIDLTVDGADWVNHSKELVKGLGAALLREKIVATASDKLVILIDNSKLVSVFSSFLLPIEVVPFGASWTQRKLQALGHSVKLREGVRSDNGNLIYDLEFSGACESPLELNRLVRETVGVVETGFFLDLTDSVFIGDANGEIKILE